MLEACQQYVVAKRSNLTHWHPVLGWFAQTIDTSLQDAMPSVKLQLACLWTGRIVTHLIGKRIIHFITSIFVKKKFKYVHVHQSFYIVIPL